MLDDPNKLPILNAKEKALRNALPRAARPKLASTIVLTHGPKDNPKILMGQRASRHDFMPSIFVFPGGRVDRGDSYAPFTGDFSMRTQRILEAAYAPRRARAIGLAAIRETYEETGLMLGVEKPFNRNINNVSWDAFREAGIMPDLSGIEVFGRAVTPPHRHKRFDTWFFVKHLDGERPQAQDSAELLGVDWFSFEEIEDLKTHRATDMMLTVLKDYFKHPKPPSELFYSRWQGGKFALTYEPF